jgi:hypothetical protein
VVGTYACSASCASCIVYVVRCAFYFQCVCVCVYVLRGEWIVGVESAYWTVDRDESVLAKCSDLPLPALLVFCVLIFLCLGNHETGKYDFDFLPYMSRFNMPPALSATNGRCLLAHPHYIHILTHAYHIHSRAHTPTTARTYMHA